MRISLVVALTGLLLVCCGEGEDPVTITNSQTQACTNDGLVRGGVPAAYCQPFGPCFSATDNVGDAVELGACTEDGRCCSEGCFTPSGTCVARSNCASGRAVAEGTLGAACQTLLDCLPSLCGVDECDLAVGACRSWVVEDGTPCTAGNGTCWDGSCVPDAPHP